MPALVSVSWLSRHLQDPGLRILDASWYLPASGRDPRAEYRAGHIPGAVFFDLDATSDRATQLPHMLPPADQFARDAGRLGIGDDTTVVVYDGSGANLSAARAWWTLRVFGHGRVSVLDGGLKKWAQEGLPLESGEVTPAPARFTPRLQAERVRDLVAVRENLGRSQEQLVDARSSGRFHGREPEPRPGVRGGHVPGSLNLPYTDLVGADGTLLPPDQLRARFERAGVDLRRPVVTMCGSGTSACAIALALEALGYPGAAVYDGSWTEWGTQPDTPVATE
jgi:thiosulfate/3-mercaptopyruvate sulfurtransferase